MSTDTEIVIEAFPCSANTFAVGAFSFAQPSPVRIAHHLHAPAQIIWGVRRDLPVLVLIREPEEAILSVLLRQRFVSLRQAMREYARFYESVFAFRDRFVLATFYQVTTAFGDAIREVNARFGTSFSEFDHTEAHVQQVMEGMNTQYLRRAGLSVAPLEDAGTIESRRERRKALKEALRTQYQEAPAKARARVHRAYAHMLSAVS